MNGRRTRTTVQEAEKSEFDDSEENQFVQTQPLLWHTEEVTQTKIARELHMLERINSAAGNA